MKGVDQYNLPNNPTTKLYRKQKTKVANQWCRHLFTYKDIGNMYDFKNDEIITMEYTFCQKCGKKLTN